MPSLLDMPIEVRFLIYEHLFAGQRITYIPTQPYNLRSAKAGHQDRWWYTNRGVAENKRLWFRGVEILLVSKLCRTEAFQMLHLHANISLTYLEDRSWRLAPSPSLTNILNHIRYVSTSADYTKGRGFHSFFKLLRNLEIVSIFDFEFDHAEGLTRATRQGPALAPDGSLTQMMCDATIASISECFQDSYSAFPRLISHWDARGRTFAVSVTGEGCRYCFRDLKSFYFHMALLVGAAPGAQASTKLSSTPVMVKIGWNHEGSHRWKTVNTELGKMLGRRLGG
ncbi:uncharacterized protein AB675_8379 [Cyphellophora attinorum]|uniref:Uncharacterized protein n=1 Tax=Cyphellophora attinorum TaxID=1664694 RepID=A0A0N1P1V9_9EURO|nr:uncharacterized protein AB675_8379 [Phialophora attinorum]KPI44402.1 hypothetical protein AB675_8379 [Phialophora attinorum]